LVTTLVTSLVTSFLWERLVAAGAKPVRLLSGSRRRLPTQLLRHALFTPFVARPPRIVPDRVRLNSPSDFGIHGSVSSEAAIILSGGQNHTFGGCGYSAVHARVPL
jgi:hypothetical protein